MGSADGGKGSVDAVRVIFVQVAKDLQKPKRRSNPSFGRRRTFQLAALLPYNQPDGRSSELPTPGAIPAHRGSCGYPRRAGPWPAPVQQDHADAHVGDAAGYAYVSLRKLKDAAGRQFRAGVVLYDGETAAPFGDGFHAVPLRHDAFRHYPDGRIQRVGT